MERHIGKHRKAKLGEFFKISDYSQLKFHQISHSERVDTTLALKMNDVHCNNCEFSNSNPTHKTNFVKHSLNYLVQILISQPTRRLKRTFSIKKLSEPNAKIKILQFSPTLEELLNNFSSLKIDDDDRIKAGRTCFHRFLIISFSTNLTRRPPPKKEKN
jgi:hypothetical protein